MATGQIRMKLNLDTAPIRTALEVASKEVAKFATSTSRVMQEASGATEEQIRKAEGLAKEAYKELDRISAHKSNDVGAVAKQFTNLINIVSELGSLDLDTKTKMELDAMTVNINKAYSFLSSLYSEQEVNVNSFIKTLNELGKMLKSLSADYYNDKDIFGLDIALNQVLDTTNRLKEIREQEGIRLEEARTEQLRQQAEYINQMIASQKQYNTEVRNAIIQSENKNQFIGDTSFKFKDTGKLKKSLEQFRKEAGEYIRQAAFEKFPNIEVSSEMLDAMSQEIVYNYKLTGEELDKAKAKWEEQEQAQRKVREEVAKIGEQNQAINAERAKLISDLTVAYNEASASIIADLSRIDRGEEVNAQKLLENIQLVKQFMDYASKAKVPYSLQTAGFNEAISQGKVNMLDIIRNQGEIPPEYAYDKTYIKVGQAAVDALKLKIEETIRLNKLEENAIAESNDNKVQLQEDYVDKQKQLKEKEKQFKEALTTPYALKAIDPSITNKEIFDYFDNLIKTGTYTNEQLIKLDNERARAAKAVADEKAEAERKFNSEFNELLKEEEAAQREAAKREAEIEAEKNRQKQRDREAYVKWWEQTLAAQEAKQREFNDLLNQPAMAVKAGTPMSAQEQIQYFNDLLLAYKQGTSEYQQLLNARTQAENQANQEQAEAARIAAEQKKAAQEEYINWWKNQLAEQDARSSKLSITADEISKINNALSQLSSKAKTGTAGEMEKMYEYTNKLNEALRILNNTESSVIDKENALKVLRGELNNQTSILSTTITQQTQAAKKAQILANANSLLTKKTSLLGRALKQVSGYLLMYLSVYRLVQVIKDAVTMSSDLIEIQNVVDTTFGDSADAINKFAKTAVRDFGMAELSAKKFASSFGATLKAAGIEENLDGLSIALTQLTGDFASFRNISYEDAFQKIQSAITGQTRGIRLYGVAVTDANLSNYALELGINKTTDAMTENEKIMLRMSFMLRAMRDSAGDFVKTQDTWANRTKLLSETWKNFLTVLGDTIRIVFTGALKWIIGFVQNLVIVMKYIRGFFAILSDASTRFDEFGDIIAGKWAAPDYSGFGDGIESEMSTIEESADDASKALDGVLASYDDVQVLSKQTGAGKSSLTAEDFNLDQLLAEQQAAMARYQSDIEMPSFDVEKLYSAVEWYNTYVKPIFDWLLNHGDAIKSVIIGIITTLLMFRGLQSIYTGITAIKTGVTGVIEAFKTLGSLFAAGGPVGIVIGVILAIVAALVLLYATSEKFRNSMNEAFKVVGDQAARIWANLQEVFSGVSELFQDFVDNLNDLGFDIKNIWDFIAEVVGGVIIIIMHILSGFIEFTVKQFGGLFQVFSGLIKFLTGVFTGDWRKAWDGILDIFAGVVKHILAGVDAIIGAINSLLGLDIPKLGDLFDDWIESKKYSPRSGTDNSAPVTFTDDGSRSSGESRFRGTNTNDVTYTPYGIDEYTLNSMMNNSANSMKNVLGDMPTEASDYMSSSSGYLDTLTSELKSTNANIGKMNTALAQASRKNINIELDGKIIGQSSVDFINGTTLRTGKTPLVGV